MGWGRTEMAQRGAKLTPLWEQLSGKHQWHHPSLLDSQLQPSKGWWAWPISRMGSIYVLTEVRRCVCNYGETIFTTKRKICGILFLIRVRSVLNLWPILGPYWVNMGICVRIDPAPPELLNPGLVSQKTGAECVQQHPPSASAPAARWLSTKCS